MYQVKVLYLDQQENTLDFEKKPSVDVKGNYLVIECGSGQKMALNINTFLCVKFDYPEPAVAKPIKYSTEIRYNTKSETTELLMHPSEPKVEVKVGGNSGVLFLKTDDNLFRVVNGEWCEGVEVDFFVEDELVVRKKK